jgi:malate dehydrogenase (oxaloacetate-decarboxylating)
MATFTEAKPHKDSIDSTDNPIENNGNEPRWISLAGFSLINAPLLNKGTAFTDEERDEFHLHGMLPPHVGNLEEQVARRLKVYREQPTPFSKYVFLRDLQDTNETLFYALVLSNVEEMLPVVYTPVVGEGCQRFSEIWHRPRGLFLSYPNRDRMEQILHHPHYDNVKCIVVSDGERILGLGDQGAGGMGIPIGKMALYTALGGIHPANCLPILLDVGTDNEERLANPLYMGWQHHRIRGQEYDDFVEHFVRCVQKRWPHVLLQWEDFAGANAARLLEHYRPQICTFNDDIQGTAAVSTATILSALNVTKVPITEQKFVILGFGSAGLGIANLLVYLLREKGLSEKEARERFYVLGRYGLITPSTTKARPEQLTFGRTDEEVKDWKRDEKGEINLTEVIRQVHPTVLIGVSTLPGAFTEEALREMAKHVERPIIFPLSNPTSKTEAKPQDIYEWTDGRALVGTGSPFDPVDWKGEKIPITQTNNSYVFPGLALGIIASRARHVTDAMIMAAARELAELAPTKTENTSKLLPPIADSRAISRAIGFAVGKQAMADGEAEVKNEEELNAELDANQWTPKYVPYKRMY